jgi:hypothetical protein
MPTNNQQQPQPDNLPIWLTLGGAAIVWVVAVNLFPFWTLTLTAAVAAAVRTVLWLRRR